MNVLNETAPVLPNASAIILVSRHFHKQTTSAIARLFPDGVKYKLDVMLVNERNSGPRGRTFPSSVKI